MSGVKGASWLARNEYFVKIGGAGAVQKIFNALDETDQALFKKPILPVSWVEYGSYLRWALVADKVLGQGDGRLVREAAVYSAQKQFSGIYKMFISFVTPHFVLGSTAKLWRQFIDTGNMTATYVGEKSDNHILLKLTDIPDIPLKHDWEQTPFMEEITRISGGKNPKIAHTQCIAKGDPCCVWDGTWE
jgi:hypothetical protein